MPSLKLSKYLALLALCATSFLGVSSALARDKQNNQALPVLSNPTVTPSSNTEEKPAAIKWGITGLGWDTHLVSYGRDVWRAGDELTGDRNGLIHPWLQLGVTRKNLHVFAGSWLDINDNAEDSLSGDIQEFDLWLGFNLHKGKWSFGMNLQRWRYANGLEVVLDTTVNFNDKDNLFKNFALNPGLKLHSQISTDNFDEANVLVATLNPGFALSKGEGRPIWLSLPVEVGFQQNGFLGNKSGHSYSSIGADLYLPLDMLHQRLGNWSVNAAIFWFDTDPSLIPLNPETSFLTAKLGLLYYF